MAEEVILKNPNDLSCINELKEDGTLNDCTTKVRKNPIPLTLEYPEKSVTDKDVKYREGLHLIEHVKSAFALTYSQGGPGIVGMGPKLQRLNEALASRKLLKSLVECEAWQKDSV